MSQDIEYFCLHCLACQSCRYPVPNKRASLQPNVVVRTFEKVAIDIIELPPTSKGYCYVLVVMDYFTKYVNLYALPDQRATTIARCLYIHHHGFPEAIHTDQGH